MFTSPDEHHIDPRSPGTPGGQSDYKKAATTSKPKSNFLLNSATVDVVLISFSESNKSLSQNLKESHFLLSCRLNISSADLYDNFSNFS